MRDVYLVDGSRTPFIKAQGEPNNLSASSLAVACGLPLIDRQNFSATDLDEVIVGCVGPSQDEANIARIIALRLGCGDHVMGWTVARNCASGLQALDCAYKDIAIGRHDLVLAGGCEAMSRSPLIYNEKAVRWFAKLAKSKTISQKLLTLTLLRPNFFFSPIIALLRGLNDPVVSMSMGQTAEEIALEFGITRQDMDNFSVNSHQKAIKAREDNVFDEELIPLFDYQGNHYANDNGVRGDSSVTKLAKLRPVFDKPFGRVTAGNSSQVTDGASMLVMASKDAVNKYDLKPIAKIVDIQWTALSPTVMGYGPAFSIAKILMENNLSISDIDYFEINEAFSAQVIGCLKALNDTKFCKEHFNHQKFGEIKKDKLNIHGGAIALGHPVGASGARISLHMANILKSKQAKRGIATLCIGGGQGGAILLDNVKGGL